MSDREEFLDRMEKQLADLHTRIVELTKVARVGGDAHDVNFATDRGVMKEQHEVAMQRLREMDAHALAHGLEEAEARLDALRDRIENALENHTRR